MLVGVMNMTARNLTWEITELIYRMTTYHSRGKLILEENLIEQIEELLRDYRWMRKEVAHLEKVLYGYSTPMKSWGVAVYGIEASLPHGSSGKSQAELKDMSIREERLYLRLKKYQEQVYAIEMAGDLLEDEKQKVIYDCLLEGMSYRSIAYHIGITRNQAKDSKKAIMTILSQKSQFVSLLNFEKSLV